MKLNNLCCLGVGGERERSEPKEKKLFGGGAYILLVYGWLSGERTVAKSSHIVGGREGGEGKQGEKGKENVIKPVIDNSK